MPAMLGTVSPNGTVHFASDDINACRAFLRSRGLECRPRKGWVARHDESRLEPRNLAFGAIYFDNRPGATWRATYWPNG